jgi:hypothetical protein
MSAEHWGRKPEDWANLAEPSNDPLFSTVLARLGVAGGTPGAPTLEFGRAGESPPS